ncbi:MAG: mechanosensitive ion channel protein MscS, partial [Pseudomonadota bacterium]
MLQDTEDQTTAEDAPVESEQAEAAATEVDDAGEAATGAAESDGAASAADEPEGGLEAALNPDEDSAIEELIGTEDLVARVRGVVEWAEANLWSIDVAIQLSVLVAALVPAAIFGPQLKKVIQQQIAPRAPYGPLKRAAGALAVIATPIALYLVLQASVIALGAAGRGSALVEAGVSLLSAWIVIRLVTLVIRSKFWSQVAFYIAWPIAALDAFGLLDNVVDQLEAFSVPLGENDAGEPVSFSALDFIRTLITFGVLFWLASSLNRFLQGRLERVEELTPSLRTLVFKILDVLMPAIAFLLALQIVGFN